MNDTDHVTDVTTIWPKETCKVKNLRSNFLQERSDKEMIRQVKFNGINPMYLLKLSALLTSVPT